MTTTKTRVEDRNTAGLSSLHILARAWMMMCTDNADHQCWFYQITDDNKQNSGLKIETQLAWAAYTLLQGLDRSRLSVFFCKTLTRSYLWWWWVIIDDRDDDLDDDKNVDDVNIQVDHSTGPAGRTALHLAAGQGWSQVLSLSSLLWWSLFWWQWW